MGKTKKIIIASVAAALILIAAIAIPIGCASSKVKANFVTYDGQTQTLSGKKGSKVEFPTVEREGYIFGGWYLTEDFSGSPLTEALFDKENTYYAKWLEAKKVTLNLNGGSLAYNGETLTGKKDTYFGSGEKLLQKLEGLTPVNGDLKFGGWFNGNNLLSEDYTLTENVEITARYQAEYVVNAYIQNTALDGYDLVEDYLKGYAFVGESFTPPVDMEGFRVNTDDNDTKVIGANKSENVFDLHFERNKYTVEIYEYYPNGEAKLINTTNLVYGVEQSLPENSFTCKGYRMLGWATKMNADYTAVLTKEAYSQLSKNVSLYPVWEKGYEDAFNGKDYIFLNHDEANSAVLVRGGIEIVGEYDEDYGIYFFRSETEDFNIKAKLDDKGRFVYYAANNKSYTFSPSLSELNEDIIISIGKANDITYYDKESGEIFEGVYTIGDDGLYTAEVVEKITKEEWEFVFTVGTVIQNDGTLVDAFRIRGEEYAYGTLPLRAMYYPTITLDGFGTAYVVVQGQTSYYQYLFENDIITFVSSSGEQYFKVLDYNGTKGFDFYNPDFDKTYINKDADKSIELYLDGCATAAIKDTQTGDVKFTGTYTLDQSLFAEDSYIITVTAANGEVRVFYTTLVGTLDFYEEKAANYTERLYVDNDGMLIQAPYLVVNGETAEMYEYRNKKFELASKGTWVEDRNGYSYVYTPETTEEWASLKYTEYTVAFDNSTDYSVYYLLATKEGDVENSYETRRFDSEGRKLTIASCFAIYIDENNNTVSGLLYEGTTYSYLSDGSKYYYFSFDEENESVFYLLENAPLVMRKRVNGKTDSSVTLTLTWKEIENNKYESVYTELDSEGNVKTLIEGYYSAEYLVYPGTAAYVYVFYNADDEALFKFYASSYSTYYYFNYFELDEIITFGKYTELKDDDIENTDVTLSLTDERFEGKLVIVLKNGETEIKGTFDTYVTEVDGEELTYAGKEETAFGKDDYKTLVYTFTAIEKAADGTYETFKFTLNSSYFRVCAENAAYTNDSGEKLELNGATHIARFTDKNGDESYSYYLIIDGVLADGKAVTMLVGEETFIFDLSGANFAKRGEESGAYNILKNGVAQGKILELDGQGKAAIFDINDESGDSKVNATYIISNDVVSVLDKNSEVLYVGKISVRTIGNGSYLMFSILTEGIEGAYLNPDDLSVVVLDNAGNVVKYNSYGIEDNGYYYRLENNVFYYVNATYTDSALYTIEGRKVFESDYSATYYADDFASIVFSPNGTVLFNNNEQKYFVYNGENGKVVVYTPKDQAEDGADINEYGFAYSEITINQGQIVYSDGTKERTYNYFDGKFVELTDVDGSILEFQPTGEATFAVDGKYKTKDAEGNEKVEEYSVCLNYKDGEPYMFLAARARGIVNGGQERYVYTSNFDLEISLDDKTFSTNLEEYKIGLVAYSYYYVYMLSYYGSTYASLFKGLYGALNIVADVVTNENGEQIPQNFTLSGALNFITDKDGNAITFTNGSLSYAGYYAEGYGHLYASEFTVGEEKYHLTFFLMPSTTAGDSMYVFMINSCTKVTGEIVVDAEENTLVYQEEFVYSTQSIKKGTDEEGNDLYYKKGDVYIPSLRYKGELINVYSVVINDSEKSWSLYSDKYVSGKVDGRYVYDIDLTLSEEDGSVVSATVKEFKLVTIETANKDVVYALYDGNGTFKKVLGIQFKGDKTVTQVDCERNEGEGESFTVTFNKIKKYTVTFTVTQTENGEKITVVIEEKKPTDE